MSTREEEFGGWEGGEKGFWGGGLTLVRDLHDGPEGFVFLLALVRRGLRVFHLVGELEERVFDVFEAWRWRFAVAACAADCGHGCRGGRGEGGNG